MKKRARTRLDRRAYRMAFAIARGVFCHPHGFAHGLIDDSCLDSFELSQASVWHRMTQLGFSPDEINEVFETAWAAAWDECSGRVDFHNDTWGRA